MEALLFSEMGMAAPEGAWRTGYAQVLAVSLNIRPCLHFYVARPPGRLQLPRRRFSRIFSVLGVAVHADAEGRQARTGIFVVQISE
jgi:hypothetical protein